MSVDPEAGSAESGDLALDPGADPELGDDLGDAAIDSTPSVR